MASPAAPPNQPAQPVLPPFDLPPPACDKDIVEFAGLTYSDYDSLLSPKNSYCFLNEIPLLIRRIGQKIVGWWQDKPNNNFWTDTRLCKSFSIDLALKLQNVKEDSSKYQESAIRIYSLFYQRLDESRKNEKTGSLKFEWKHIKTMVEPFIKAAREQAAKAQAEAQAQAAAANPTAPAAENATPAPTPRTDAPPAVPEAAPPAQQPSVQSRPVERIDSRVVELPDDPHPAKPNPPPAKPAAKQAAKPSAQSTAKPSAQPAEKPTAQAVAKPAAKAAASSTETPQDTPAKPAAAEPTVSKPAATPAAAPAVPVIKPELASLFPIELWGIANLVRERNGIPLYIDLAQMGVLQDKTFEKEEVNPLFKEGMTEINEVQQLDQLLTDIDRSIANMHKIFEDTTPRIAAVSKAGFDHREHIRNLGRAFHGIGERLIAAKQQIELLKATRSSPDNPSNPNKNYMTNAEFDQLRSEALPGGGGTLYTHLKQTLENIEAAAGIKDNFRAHLTTMMNQIMEKDGAWKAIGGNAAAVNQATPVSVAKDLEDCLNAFVARNPQLETKLARGGTGVTDELFTWFLKLMYPNHSNRNVTDYISVTNRATIFTGPRDKDDYHFPSKKIEGKRWLLASYVHNSGGHFTVEVADYRGQQKNYYFNRFDNLGGKPTTLATGTTTGNIRNNRDPTAGTIVVNTHFRESDKFNMQLPYSETWVMPKWQNNNCYLSAAIIQLCTYHYYYQMFKKGGKIVEAPQT